MDRIRLVCDTLFIHLLILMVAQQSGAREIDGSKLNDNASDVSWVDSMPKEANVLRLHSMDHEENVRKGIRVEANVHHQHVHSPSSSHSDHLDPLLMVFFNLDDLKLGKSMLVYFPNRVFSSSDFLPKEEADLIPFSLKELPNLLHLFSFSQGSPQATAMEDTLRGCETNPIKGETKLCATSMASMLDFAQDIFGIDKKIKVLSTIYLTRLSATLQKYTITEVPNEISASKMVACHTMPYPYGILYCHSQETENRVYRVPLVGEHGDKIEAIAVCHMDTTEWSHTHVSFRVLGVEPGSQPVCHFFPADNIVLVPSTST